MVLGSHPGEYVVATLFKAPFEREGLFLLLPHLSSHSDPLASGRESSLSAYQRIGVLDVYYSILTNNPLSLIIFHSLLNVSILVPAYPY